MYLIKFLGWLKKFGQAQKILRPVKGQGMSVENVAPKSKYPKLSVKFPCFWVWFDVEESLSLSDEASKVTDI